MALTKVKNVIDITADTMADLLSMEHKTGSVQLLGFHERGDGGGGVFFWDDSKSQSEHNGGTIIAGDAVLGTWDTAGQEAWFTAPSVGVGCWVREYSGAVNVKWFGAKGDGITDDTAAIQKTFDSAWTNSYTVLIDSGVFLNTGLTVKCPQEPTYYDRKRLYISGKGVGISILQHTGVGTALESIGENDTVSSVFGLNLSDFSIKKSTASATDTTNGIKLQKGTGYSLSFMSIEGGINSIYMPGDIWLSRFTNLKLSGSPSYGINMSASGTSNHFDQCYVTYSTVAAYRLSGNYSHIGTLAADNCSGDFIYHFNYWSGGVGSLGCENPDVTHVVRAVESNLNVSHLNIFRPEVSGVKGLPLSAQGSAISLDTITITHLTEGASFPQQLFYQLDSQVGIENIEANCTFTEQWGNPSDVNGFATISNKNGQVALRQGGARAYLGLDRRGQNKATVDDGNVHSVAIFLDANGAPRYTSDGVDRRYQVGATNGDWFIEADPANHHCAGHVATVDSSDLSGISAKKIPLVLSGATAGRPATPYYVGLQYYDTSLGLPIWWDGSSWKDAAGSIV